ncbi:hypothetical protein PNIG_a0187 [Pseudoalteromonas nigrifaciens]|uniref:Uncharacterized protein n=1 Tax=Pseudoalteromonas nigrifaciens TaxID=28109 RepID=A0AAC9UBL9_9GAMM|nr:hypothetical protein PNIG_a0187 [Pseudoalteromonas nigrifaciens]SJN23417.1 hypothetical protein CZ797_03420 [Pseudoalteromonas sp. JB197]
MLLKCFVFYKLILCHYCNLMFINIKNTKVITAVSNAHHYGA